MSTLVEYEKRIIELEQQPLNVHGYPYDSGDEKRERWHVLQFIAREIGEIAWSGPYQAAARELRGRALIAARHLTHGLT